MNLEQLSQHVHTNNTLKKFNIFSHQGNKNEHYLEIHLSHLSEWLRLITQVTAHSGEDAE